MATWAATLLSTLCAKSPRASETPHCLDDADAVSIQDGIEAVSARCIGGSFESGYDYMLLYTNSSRIRDNPNNCNTMQAPTRTSTTVPAAHGNSRGRDMIKLRAHGWKDPSCCTPPLSKFQPAAFSRFWPSRPSTATASLVSRL